MKLLAFDLGGSAMKSGVVDEAFQITHKQTYILEGVSRESKRRPEDRVLCGIRDAEDFADAILHVREELPEAVDGIAFSYNCPVDYLTGDAYAGGMTQRFLNGINFPELFYTRCEIPVSVAKDSVCMLLAEAEAGSLRGVKNALAVGLGSGIALGILINGEPYQGHRCASGEASTVPDAEYGVLAGRTGMWGLLNRIGKALDKEPEMLNGYTAFQAVRSGNPKAQEAFRQYIGDVCSMLAGFTYLFAPEVIAVGGGIAADPMLTEEIQKEFAAMRTQNADIYCSEPRIERCRFLNDANLIGAAIAHRKYLQYQNKIREVCPDEAGYRE